MRNLVKGLLGAAFDRLSTRRIEGLTLWLVRGRLAVIDARAAMTFLMHLDERLYTLQGSAAVTYGGGVHTKHRHTRYHDFFVERVNEGERVLDIGCGNGALSRDVAQRTGAEVLGIDSDAANLAEARARHAHPSVRYETMDATGDLPEGPFDVVILSNVLEHLADRPAFLRRLAKRSGARRVLVRVPLFERDWRVPLKHELGVEWRLDPTHETEYTAESFAAEMREAELSIRHAEHRWGEIWAEILPGGDTRS